MFKKLAISATAAFIFTGTSLFAATIGNWDGGSAGRGWDGQATINGLMTGRGHTVEAAGAMTAANLANDDVFVITEATRSLVAQEVADLVSWVTGGGRLLITVDSGGTGVANGNSILSAIGSTMSFSGSATNGPLQAGNFLTEGGPFNIVGQTLQVTPGTALGVGGGLGLAGTYVGVEALGSGYVFGFGDHLQNELFNNSAGNVNGQMHINLVESAPSAVPLPAGLPLLLSALAGFGLLRWRSRT